MQDEGRLEMGKDMHNLGVGPIEYRITSEQISKHNFINSQRILQKDKKKNTEAAVLY
jgi:hypothetical protein